MRYEKMNTVGTLMFKKLKATVKLYCYILKFRKYRDRSKRAYMVFLFFFKSIQQTQIIVIFALLTFIAKVL